MNERRRKLIKYLYKKEGRLHQFEESYKSSIESKKAIIKKFTSVQLENLLRTSTKNEAQQVVSTLIPIGGGLGVLADIDRALSIEIPKSDNFAPARTAPTTSLETSMIKPEMSRQHN
jgi:hypothetical protein